MGECEAAGAEAAGVAADEADPFVAWPCADCFGKKYLGGLGALTVVSSGLSLPSSVVLTGTDMLCRYLLGSQEIPQQRAGQTVTGDARVRGALQVRDPLGMCHKRIL